jgi:dihydropyrimidine dehydrogenase (NADP+)
MRVHSFCITAAGNGRILIFCQYNICLVLQVIVKDGKIKVLELLRTEQNDAVCMAILSISTTLIMISYQGEWVEDPDQVIRLKVDFIISAFGSELGFGEISEAMSPVTFHKWGSPIVDPETMATSEPGVFCGGDIAGVANVRQYCMSFSMD